MSLTITGVIVVLVLLLVLAGIVYYAYWNIRNKIRSFSRIAFGTDSIKEGFNKIEAEYAVTPKSVSAATNLYLPRIMRDFPDFHYDEMKKRAENVLVSYLRSIDSDKTSLLAEGTAELKNQLEMLLEMQRSRGERERFEQIKIHQTEIYQYRYQKGRRSVVFQSAVEYYHYRTQGGNLTAGSKNTKEQSKYNVECIYIQDRDFVENVDDAALGVNCPNCGAPLSGLGAKVCAYCGTPVMELNIRSWNFSEVKEV
ncbi:MAG: zinc ribbon domain-containing protein, partial [Lachnospiraceae bacterium]|nr:zinc ribbon domain-containing protein [Lachnospiraceae bacterium]